MNDGLKLTDELTLVEETIVTEEEATQDDLLVESAVRATEKATMDVLDMKSASDIGSLDLKKIAEEVDAMNYLQLRATKKQMEQNLSMVEAYHTIYKQVADMSGDFTEAAAKINLSHQLNAVGIDQDAESFYNEYNDIKENIEAVLEVLNPKLAEYDDKAKSTKFLTEQMLLSVDQQIAALKENEDYDEYTLECYESIRKVYENRMLAVEYMKNYKRDLRKMKKMARTESHSMMKRVQADLESRFQASSLGAFEKYLVAAFGGDTAAEEAAIVCLGMLAKSMTTDNYLRHDEYGKVFIMNGLDLLAGIWDVDGISPDDYTAQVKELFDLYRIDHEAVS